MNSRILVVVAIFIASSIIGWNLITNVGSVQAANPVIPSIIELPSFPKVIKTEEKLSTPVIDVIVDLSTKELTVKGSVDAIVNVKTINEPSPIVKYKTRVIEKEVNNGYPYVKSIGQTSDTPISPITIVKNNRE